MNTGPTKDGYTVQQWVNIARQATTPRERRAALHHALMLAPGDKRLHTAFRGLHKRTHYQQAVPDGVFICYSGADDLLAVDLAETLREVGIRTWIDMLDIPLEAGADVEWEDEVRAALDACGLMLLVLSPEAVANASVQAEVAYFMRAGKVVLPLVHRDCDPRLLQLRQPMLDYRDAHTGLAQLYGLLGITANS